MNNDLTFTNKKKTLISLALTLTVIAGLLAIASFFDLQISRILTKGSLKVGEYISSSGFALFFEAVGSSPLYLMVSLAGVIVFWFGVRLDKKLIVRVLVTFVGAVMVIAGFYLTFSDIFEYVGAFVGQKLTAEGATDVLIENAEELMGSLYIDAICLVMAVAGGLALISLWKKVKKEDNEKYIWWSLAIVCTVAFYLIVHFIKSPIGRVRFRTMHYLESTALGKEAFDLYTPWYVINGKRKLWDVAGANETNTLYNFVSDACKSFPSGHTFSAGMVYTLLALPYLNKKFATKKSRAILWTVTICYTALVAISRIVAGAHYMSDVLVGGSLSFGGAMITREIFICRGLHFKQLFGKKKELLPISAETAISNDEVEATVGNETQDSENN